MTVNYKSIAFAVGVGLVIMLFAGWVGAMDIQQTSKDVKAGAEAAKSISPYLWEILAFLGVLTCLRATNWIKRQRWFPTFLCNLKTSKNGKHQYHKLKPFYIKSFAHLSSFGALLITLNQKYPLDDGLIIACAVISASVFVLIEGAFALINSRSPELAEALANGVYVPEEEMTVMAKVTQTLITGGGVDKR